MDELNVQEAAKELSVTEMSIRNYIVGGKLKATKKSKGLRFYYVIKRVDLENFKKEFMIE